MDSRVSVATMILYAYFNANSKVFKLSTPISAITGRILFTSLISLILWLPSLSIKFKSAIYISFAPASFNELAISTGLALDA